MSGARFGGTLTWADAADPPSIGVHHITRAWYTDCQPEKSTGTQEQPMHG